MLHVTKTARNELAPFPEQSQHTAKQFKQKLEQAKTALILFFVTAAEQLLRQFEIDP